MSRLWLIGLRNVSRNRRRSLITFLAIFVGVTVLVTLKGFINGFLEMSVRSVVEGKTGALQVHRKGYLDDLEGAPLKLSMPYSKELVDRIGSVEGVTAVTGRIQFNGLVNNGLSQTMFVGQGADLDTLYRVMPRAGADLAPGGRRLKEGDYRVALVGEELAQSFNVVPEAEVPKAKPATNGVPVTALLTLNSSSPEGRANSLSVTTEGLIASEMPFENKRIVTVPLTLAQDLLNMKGKVTEYAVAVDNLSHLDRITAALGAKLGPDYEVSAWTDLQPITRDIMTRQRVLFGVITTVLVVIVLTGIVNAMLMSVFERVREIGTMLAVGVRRGQILALFLIEASVLGLAGGIAGSALGRLLIALMHRKGIPMPSASATFPERIRPALSLGYLGAAIGLATLAALAASLYPAWKASKLKPVDALRSV